MNILTNLSLKRYAYEKVCSQECETLCSLPPNDGQLSIKRNFFLCPLFRDFTVLFKLARWKVGAHNVIVIFRSTCKYKRNKIN